MATDNSDDLAIMNGFAFGNGLETKGEYKFQSIYDAQEFVSNVLSVILLTSYQFVRLALSGIIINTLIK